MAQCCLYFPIILNCYYSVYNLGIIRIVFGMTFASFSTYQLLSNHSHVNAVICRNRYHIIFLGYSTELKLIGIAF